MKLKLIILSILFIAAFSARAQQGFPFDNEIREFKKQDSLKFPPKNGILFIGSSSIRLWSDLEDRFAGKPIIKRGVGGCTLAQLVDFYTPYVCFRINPKRYLFMPGKMISQAIDREPSWLMNLPCFGQCYKKKLPAAQIYFMAIKPSPSRAKYLPEVKIANARIKAFLMSKRMGHYIDLASVIMNPKTMQPDSSLFKGDYLHLNSKGYDKWQAVLQPYVK